MIPLREVPVIDANAEALGATVATLMERAGRAVAERVAAESPAGPVAVLAGPGMNGGDGLVAARLLAPRFDVRVVTPVEPPAGFRTALARHAWEALPADVPTVRATREDEVADAIRPCALVLDALLGAGLAGPLREPYAAYARAVNASGRRVISVDVPTGLGGDLAVRPAATITFHAPKEGMTRENSGDIHVADIGIPPAAVTHTGPGEMRLYPRARADQHKGEGGIVLVIGGGPYTGAPAVAGLAALRAGGDLAIVLTPRRAWQVVAAFSPNLVVRPLNRDDLDFQDPENRVALNLWLRKAHSVVLGPGLGLAETTMASVRHVIERATREGKPVVCDADAIAAVAEKRDLLNARVVVTCHKREFRTLTGRDAPDEIDKRAEVARQAASELGCAVLLKGPVDVATDGRRVKLNATGHPAMSVGGTGDALAGIVGALLAKGLDPFDAARLGAWISGRAGEIAVDAKSYGLVATDVVEAIPGVLKTHL